MSRILLYKPGLNDGSQQELPNIGMAILGKSIKEDGNKISVFDWHFKPPYGIRPFPTKIDIICLSLVSQEWEEANLFIDNYGKDTLIIIGGPHAFSYWDILEKDERIWKVVVGEADGQWDKIINSPEKVVFLDKPEKLYTPDFSNFMGIENMKAYPLYTSRGCTARCSFCVGSKNHGKYRKRDIIEIMAELKSISILYPSVEKIYVIDDCFSGDIEHAKIFLWNWLVNDYEKKYELQIINVRADQIDYELLNLMKLSGVKMLPIGVESADPEVFKHVGKGETLDDIRKAITMIQNAGITPWMNMIVGLPYDNPERHKNSLEWCLSIPQPRIVHWFQMAPFRKTKAYDYFLQQGCFEDGFIPSPYGRRYDELPWESGFETEDFSKEERMLAQLEGYLRCHSPVLVNSLERVKKICEANGMMDIFREWESSSNIKEYVEKELPKKVLKGQVNG